VDVEHVVGEEHAHDLADRELEDLFLLDLAVFEGEPGDRLAALAGEEKASLGVARHADPGAVDFGVGAEDVLDLEVRQRLELVGRAFLGRGEARREDQRGGEEGAVHGDPFHWETSTSCFFYTPAQERIADPGRRISTKDAANRDWPAMKREGPAPGETGPAHA